MSDSWPDADKVAALFGRICTGDPLTQSDFIVAVLDPLAAHLRRWRRDADEHLCTSAAGEAVLALVRNPASYDPSRRGLIGFLCISAECDLRNALKKEQKHHINRDNSECVELAPDRGNISAGAGADEAPFDDPRLAPEIASFDEIERRVFGLMRAGARATAAYVPILGIGHLPADEQERAVRRVKDRILVRLKRAGRML